MKLLKLTRKSNGEPLWVNMEMAQAFDHTNTFNHKDGTDIIMSASECFTVTETPEAIAAMLSEPAAAKCTWTYNEHTCQWDGTCGVAWTMISGRLLENHMHYCPRCGGKISEVV